MPITPRNNLSNEPVGFMYVGFVKEVADKKKAGRIRVWIPELESREEDKNGWIMCNYCSPFAGATNWQKNSNSEFDTFEKTQTSYGFWAVPPDINNEVLVVFPNGDMSRALWIGCVFKEFMNHMVPGHAASAKNKNIAGKKIPVAEYNKFDKKSSDAAKPLDPVRPWFKPHVEGIGAQGLIQDEIRGITESSAQRDEVSQVYGMNTPGPEHETVKGARQGGHNFILDDSPGSEYIGLKTRSGAQFRIDETNGLIYAINKTGTSWMQMDADGNFDIFAAKSISIRSQENLNFRADKDINFEAGQNVYVKAAMDTDAELAIIGEGQGVGGNIFLQALNDTHTTVKNNSFITVINGNLDVDVQTGNTTVHVAGNVDTTVDGNVTENTTGTYNQKVTDTITIETESTYSVKSTNYNLETSGNIQNTGDTVSDGDMFTTTLNTSAAVLAGGAISAGGAIAATGAISSAADIASSSQSLDALAGHAHNYDTPEHVVGTSTTTGFSQSGTVTTPTAPGTSSATGPTAAASAAVTVALTKPLVPAVNVLSTFPTTSATTNGGKTVEIPDWWNRETQEINTIVERLMTYEPCPIHIQQSTSE